jgi:hypothetical protein
MRYSYTAQRTKNSATEKADHCTFGHGQGQRRTPLAPIAKTPIGSNNIFDAARQKLGKNSRA